MLSPAAARRTRLARGGAGADVALAGRMGVGLAGRQDADRLGDDLQLRRLLARTLCCLQPELVGSGAQLLVKRRGRVGEAADYLGYLIDVALVVVRVDLGPHPDHRVAAVHLRCCLKRQEHPLLGVGVEVGGLRQAGVGEDLVQAQVLGHVAERELLVWRGRNDRQIYAEGRDLDPGGDRSLDLGATRWTGRLERRQAVDGNWPGRADRGARVWLRGDGLEVVEAVSYTHLRAHETDSYLVCR